MNDICILDIYIVYNVPGSITKGDTIFILDHSYYDHVVIVHIHQLQPWLFCVLTLGLINKREEAVRVYIFPLQVCSENPDTAGRNNYFVTKEYVLLPGVSCKQKLDASWHRDLKQRAAVRPHWVPNSSAAKCAACHCAFSLLRSRHHCRACGMVFCEHCSSRTLPLPALAYFTAQRVCEMCYRDHAVHALGRNGSNIGVDWTIIASDIAKALPAAKSVIYSKWEVQLFCASTIYERLNALFAVIIACSCACLTCKLNKEFFSKIQATVFCSVVG